MSFVPTSEQVTVASFMKVLGTGSMGTVWLVADEADTAPLESAGNRLEQSLLYDLPQTGSREIDRYRLAVLRRAVTGFRRSGGSAPQLRRGCSIPAACTPIENAMLLLPTRMSPLVPRFRASSRSLLPSSNGSRTRPKDRSARMISPRAPLRRALKVSPNPRVSIEKMASEQELLAQLHHPFIVRFHGSSSDEHKTYLCVEAAIGMRGRVALITTLSSTPTHPSRLGALRQLPLTGPGARACRRRSYHTTAHQSDAPQ